MEAHAIASAGVPVLCVDTCSILDIMRDPTRETSKPHDRRAAIDLVVASESGRLMCLIAEQASIEFHVHDGAVQEEAESKLKKFREQVARINEISSIYGTEQSIDLSYLDDHVYRSREIVGRWLSKITPVIPSPSAPSKAFARVNAGLAPARRGKDSSKDCLIYETYLEASVHLRNAGVEKPIVFLSSNTSEYLDESRTLKSEIANDFDRLGILYAQNTSLAKHLLGL